MFTAAVLFVCASVGAQGRPPTDHGRGHRFPPQLETYGDAYLAPTPHAWTPRAFVASGPFTSVQVNVDGSGNNIVGDAANEPSIAVDPTNPNNIVIGWRQFDNVASNFRQAGWGYSHNGGATWTFPGSIDAGIFRSDPVLEFDNSGTIFYNSLTVNGNDWHCDTFVTTDAGVSWGAANFSYGGDKTWTKVDRTGGVGEGNMYELWSTAGNNFFPNQFSRSSDGGVNWISPIQLQSQQQVWGTMAVDPLGDLYLSGQSSNLIYVSKSTTAKFVPGTPTWDSTINVPLGGTFVFGGAPNPGGLLGQVWIRADRSSGPLHGNIYVLCSMDPPGTDPLDVFLARSEDGGATWSAPVRVNDDPANLNAWQWFGTMGVAPNGRIDVVWNDTRTSLAANLSQTYYSYSLDGGRTWTKNQSMTPTWDSTIGWPNQNKIGDYYEIVSDATGADLAYSATFNGEQDVYFSRIVPTPPVSTFSLFTLNRGVILSGSELSLADSDDSYLVIRPGLTLTSTEAPINFVVGSSVGTDTPTEIGFLLEAHANTPNLAQKIEFFNYVTNSYEAVDTRQATTKDSITHVHITTNPSRFIEPGTHKVQTRVTFKASGPVLLYPWRVSVDRANWTIVQ
ncbi:MAG TPA: hypothetical protein VNI20_00615 [Fimbriimonadaceae bacterium]|nr:hypothetical protein [Fimbriimonadaceae bacterium]